MKLVGLGSTVLISDGTREPVPAIVVKVWTPNLISATAFLPNGNTSLYTDVMKKGEHDEGSNYWEWPQAEFADLLVAGAPIDTMYGGFNVMSLLGGDFANIAGPLLVMIYQTNRTRIREASGRIMTPPASAVDYALDRLGIVDAAARDKVRAAISQWSEKGGDVLLAISDALAEKAGA